MKKDLSIIIVNYNGRKYFEKCIQSIQENFTHVEYEIIVFDNYSSDDSISYLTNHFPEVILIKSEINLGFGKGNNEAVKYANAETILLLNNDTIILNDFSELINFVRNDPKAGAIGINMLDKNKKYLVPGGKFPSIASCFKIKNGAYTDDFEKGIFTAPYYKVDWMGGSFILMRKAIYNEINGFDEDYFMYVEDVDLCKKIADNGYQNYFFAKYNYIHFVGFNPKKNPLLIKGYRTYLKKHTHGLNYILCSIALTLNSLVKKIKLIMVK